jgi:hypothetical protein
MIICTVHHSSLVAWQKAPFLIGAIPPEALRYAIGGSILIELQIGHEADLRIGLGDLRIAKSRVEIASPPVIIVYERLFPTWARIF